MFVLIDNSQTAVTSAYIGRVFSQHRTLEAATGRYVREYVARVRRQPVTMVSGMFIYEIGSRVRKGQRLLRRAGGYRLLAEATDKADRLAGKQMKSLGLRTSRRTAAAKSAATQSTMPKAKKVRPAKANKQATPTRRGRPPKKGPKATAHIGIAVTPRERKEMEAAAKRQAMRLSEYLRWLHARHLGKAK